MAESIEVRYKPLGPGFFITNILGIQIPTATSGRRGAGRVVRPQMIVVMAPLSRNMVATILISVIMNNKTPTTHSTHSIFSRGIIVLCILAFFPRLALSTTFEEMLSGFDRCQFKDVYIDLITKKPVHSYFLERRLDPCEIKEDMAYFCLNERFYRLPIYKLMVPAGTFDIHAIYIGLPINESRNIIRKKFATEYRKSRLSDIGEEPELLADPDDSSKSILMCDPRSE